MSIVVQKYGGSSVKSIEKIRKVAQTVIQRKCSGDDVIVVVSAMGDTTDHLNELAYSVTNHPDKRELDALLSTGEAISSALLAMTIKELGYDAVSYTGLQLGIRTVGDYGKALIDDIDSGKKLIEMIKDKIVIVAGFQGVNEEGDTTTLGRGGSDTTAVALAVKLNGICEIYTDVDGIYSVDPRTYLKAHKLDRIDYEEMLELSSLGAQVMHSRAIELGQKYQIPIYVGLSNGQNNGTIIQEVMEMRMEEKPVTGLATSDSDVAITIMEIENVENIVSRLFEKIASKKINIDMISQTVPINNKIHLSFTIPKADLRECMEIIEPFLSKDHQLVIDQNITKFSIVGMGMKTTSGVASRLLNVFCENRIGVKMITTSEIRITCAINQEEKQHAITLVAEEFDL